MVVDNESEIVSFRSARRRCHGNQFCCRWMQVASGAAGSANVWLFLQLITHSVSYRLLRTKNVFPRSGIKQTTCKLPVVSAGFELVKFLVIKIQDGGRPMSPSDPFCVSICCCDFLIFQMAPVHRFFEITNFNSRTFQRHVLHQLAKFFGDRLYRRRDDSILAFLMKCKNSLDDHA